MKPCGPDTPTLVSSSREAKLFADEGGKKARSPGRARYKPVNHRAGKAGLPPLNLYARVHFYPITAHTGPRVQRAPGLPCALLAERAASRRKPRAPRAARSRTYILSPKACFAWLAMTWNFLQVPRKWKYSFRPPVMPLRIDIPI